MSGVVPVVPRFKFWKNGNNPVSNGSVTVYLAGSSTLVNTYQDSDLQVLNTNPVNLDADGECMFWVDPAKTYRFLVTAGLNGTGATVRDVDNIPGASAGSAARLSFTPAGSPAETTTVQTYLRNFVISSGYGIVHDDATDNLVKAQALIDYLASIGGGTILWAPGIARVTNELVMKDNVWIVGMDHTSGIRNVYGGASNNRKSPLRLGYWAVSFNGTKAIGDPNPYVRQIDRYLANAVVTEGSASVTLATPADAGNFTAGQIAYLRSQEFVSQTSTGVDLEVPLQNSLVRVLSANAGTGVVTFENPAGFTSATAPYLCRITPGAAGDADGTPYFAQNVRVERLKLIGRVAMGNNNPGMYNCHFRDITGDVQHIIQANGFVRSSLVGFTGTFVDRVVETKFCAHDSYVKNVIATAPTLFTGGLGMFSFGEFCRNITVSDFLVMAPLRSGGQIVQAQPGKNCKVLNGKVFAPSAVNAVVVFFADASVALENVEVDGVEFHTGAGTAVQFSSGTNEAKNCNVRRSKFFTTSAAVTPIAAAFLGGQGNTVEDCWFEKGEVAISGATAIGNRVQSCVFPNTPTGANLPFNHVFGCRAIAADGTITEHRERFLTASVSYDPPPVGVGAVTPTQTITVTGAVLGDFARAIFTLDTQGLELQAWVSAADTVSFRFVNPAGAAGSVDLAGGTVRVRVMKV